MKQDKHYGKIGEGSYVGEVPFLYSSTERPMLQPVTYKVNRNVLEGYSLSGTDFQHTLHHFPDLQEVMKLVAHQRLEKLHLVDQISLTQLQQERDLQRQKKTQIERMKQLNDLFVSHGDKSHNTKIGALGVPSTPVSLKKCDSSLDKVEEADDCDIDSSNEL